MKISETKRNSINEGPLDLLTRSGREQRSAFRQGQKTVKLTTQNLMRQFAEYLGNQGLKNYTQASVEDMKNFLDSKNVDTSDLDQLNSNRALTKEFVKTKFQEKSREAASGNKRKAQADPSDAPKVKSKRTEPEVSKQDSPQFKSKRSEPGKTTQSASVPKGFKLKGPDGKDYVWRGAAWTAGNSNKLAKKEIGQQLTKQAQSAVNSLPQDVQSLLGSLSDEQKQLVKSLL